MSYGRDDRWWVARLYCGNVTSWKNLRTPHLVAMVIIHVESQSLLLLVVYVGKILRILLKMCILLAFGINFSILKQFLVRFS